MMGINVSTLGLFGSYIHFTLLRLYTIILVLPSRHAIFLSLALQPETELIRLRFLGLGKMRWDRIRHLASIVLVDRM
jgi:hypothetical protein